VDKFRQVKGSCQLPAVPVSVDEHNRFGWDAPPTDLSYQKPTVPVSQEYWRKGEIRAMWLGKVKEASEAGEADT
jgi:hypothetical protein